MSLVKPYCKVNGGPDKGEVRLMSVEEKFRYAMVNTYVRAWKECRVRPA